MESENIATSIRVKDSIQVQIPNQEYEHVYLNAAKLIEEGEGLSVAFPEYKKIFNIFQGEKNWEGMLYAGNKMATYYSINGEQEKLIPLTDQLLETGYSHLDSTNLQLGDTHFLLGRYYDRNGASEKAIYHHSEALKIRKLHLGTNNLSVADSYYGLGDVYFYVLSDFHTAEDYYQKSMDIKSKQLDSTNADLLMGYYALASVNRLNDDSDQAIIFANKALSIGRLHLVENARSIAFCYNLLGNLHFDIHRWNDAQRYYELAIEIIQEYKLNENVILSTAYNGLGSKYIEEKSFEKAYQYLNVSWKIFENNHLNHPELYTKIHLNLGQVHSQLNNSDSALYYLHEAIRYAEENFEESNSQVAIGYELLGDYYLHKDNYQLAIENFQMALESLHENFQVEDIAGIPDISSEFNDSRIYLNVVKKAIAMHSLGMKNQDLPLLKSAMDYYLLGDNIIDLKRNSELRDASMLSLTENYVQNRTENAIDCAFQLFAATKDKQYVENGFHLMEKSKYMVLFESILKQDNQKLFGIPKALADLDKSLRSQVFYHKKILYEQLNKPSKDDAQIREIQNKIFEISTKQQALLDTIKTQYPEFFKIRYDSISLDIDFIQQILGDYNESIIEYFNGDEEIYIIHITDEDVNFKKIHKPGTFEEDIETYINQLANIENVFDSSAFLSYTKSAKNLFDVLLKPLTIFSDSLFSNNSENLRIKIIPHSILSVIPFESLISNLPTRKQIDYKNLDYLINFANFSYAYSANLLFKQTGKENNGHPKLLGFSYSDDKNTPTNNVNEIIGTSLELDAIEKIVNTDTFKGINASENNFKNQAPNYEILHLALHALVDSTNQFENSLLFKSEIDTVEDGILHGYELLNIDLNAHLVVLSACETGLGKLIKGEGIFSIARSFAYAGCPSIIMSYWKADDLNTAKIMANFYTQLSNGASIDYALNKAKIQYIESADEFTAHPSSWAAFVPLGKTTEKIYRKESGVYMIYVIGIAALAILAIWIIALKTKKSKV